MRPVKTLSRQSFAALRKSRFGSVSMAHRAWWLSTPQNRVDERGRSKSSHDPT